MSLKINILFVALLLVGTVSAKVEDTRLKLNFSDSPINLGNIKGMGLMR
jgi:hypothetical protein